MRQILLLALLLSICSTIFSTQHHLRRKKIENHGIKEVYIDYGAAIWGAQAPDYRMAITEPGTTILLRSLVFVDIKTASYYEFDMYRVKENVMKMMDEANKYLNQLGIGLIIVGIYQTNRGDLSLQSFQEYRNTRLSKLPEHDFATLLSFKYAGGLAYVNGMCSPHSVSLAGYYPSEPRAMGSIFFHEVAHLVGVPHRNPNESIYVPNCHCTPKDSLEEGGCLKVPGFDHDCTAQQVVNVIYKSKCIMRNPYYETSEPICGNGIVEADEECDCGIPSRCSDLNCQPHTCRYHIQPFLFILVLVSLCIFVCLAAWFIVRYFVPNMLSCFKRFKNKHDKHSPYQNGQITMLAASPYQNRKLTSPGSSSGSSTVLVVNDSRTIQRPKVPPPPPPPKATILVANNGSYNSTSTTELYHDGLYDDFTDEEFDSEPEHEQPSTYPLPTGVPTCPSYPPKAPINRVTVDLSGPRGNNSTGATTNSTTSSSN